MAHAGTAVTYVRLNDRELYIKGVFTYEACSNGSNFNKCQSAPKMLLSLQKRANKREPCKISQTRQTHVRAPRLSGRRIRRETHENPNVLRPLTLLRHSERETESPFPRRSEINARYKSSRDPRQFRIKPSRRFRYIYFDERPRGNGSCITMTSAPLRKQKDGKASQNGGVKRTCPTFAVREQNGKSETTVLNPNDIRSKERRRDRTERKVSPPPSLPPVYLWMTISR